MAPGSRPHWRFGKAAQLQLNDGPNPQEAAAAARVRAAHRARRMYKILKEEDFVC
uniref:Uncharacterized protein n=1 Tax=Oryza barthii TaxID=65489 RepID=A0A0D3FM03_9ORYZ